VKCYEHTMINCLRTKCLGLREHQNTTLTIQSGCNQIPKVLTWSGIARGIKVYLFITKSYISSLKSGLRTYCLFIANYLGVVAIETSFKII
jgi:hypothetical protein